MIPEASNAMQGAGPDLGHMALHFVLQLAVIIIAARLGGSLFRRALKLPRVLGELCAGILIGPYALGRLPLPGYGPMFPLYEGPMPVSPELYAIATLASIVLLFMVGLETDVAIFLRYSITGTAVGVGGIVCSFVLGDLCAVWFGFAEHCMDPTALFLGTIATATSVGITARVLSDRQKLASPEGVTIMAAAVLDDVLGIIVLAVVVGIVKVEQMGGAVDWGQIGIIAGKALGFWLACTAIGLLSGKRISRLLKMSRTPATIASLALGRAPAPGATREPRGVSSSIRLIGVVCRRPRTSRR